MPKKSAKNRVGIALAAGAMILTVLQGCQTTSQNANQKASGERSSMDRAIGQCVASAAIATIWRWFYWGFDGRRWKVGG